RRPAIVALRPVALGGKGAIARECDLDAPPHVSVGMAFRRRDHRGDAELGGPFTRRNLTRHEATLRAPRHVTARRRAVVGLAREALPRDGDVRVTRAAPATELLSAPRFTRGPRIPE